MHVRNAFSSDALEIKNVLITSITLGCYKDHHNHGAILSNWLKNKTIKEINKWISDPKTYFIVASLENKIVGVGQATHTGFTTLCYVHPDFFYRGVGKKIMTHLENKLINDNIFTMKLNSTLAGLGFYKKIGFLMTSEPIKIFGLTAIPMEKNMLIKRS